MSAIKMIILSFGIFAVAGCNSMTAQTPHSQGSTLSGEPPIIIAHRGASGARPEHTLAAYNLAIDMGADFIEPDLVITKDGHLIVRHDRHLSTTTDISAHPEFADRKTEKPGHDGADWFAEDFTLAEIKTLRAVQPRQARSQEFNGRFEIPTFDEVLDLAVKRSKDTGRRIGVYPETKQPAALGALGLTHDEAMLDSLKKHGFSGPSDPVFIQSFEAENLKRLRGKTDVRLVFLLGSKPDMTFADVASFADGIGPYKKFLLGDNGEDTGFVKQAHQAGLLVHPWTFRDDDVGAGFSNISEELEAYIGLGIDGVFSDFPDTAIRIRDK